MITHVEYGAINDRQHSINYLQQQQFSRVIDVGASYNLWAGDAVTHVVDINSPSNPSVNHFQGNMCEDTVWTTVKQDVNTHGMFDYAICTHTLEDILDPIFVVKHICSIASEGIVAMPSKWVELSRSTRQFKGWLHHRWLFDVIDGELICVPKLPYLEYVNTDIFQGKPEEIRIYWKNNLPIKILNNDFIGPSEAAYMTLVMDFLAKNS